MERTGSIAASAGLIGVLLGLVCSCPSGCRRQEEPATRQVVVYTALDRSFSEPILAKFERRTGIKPRVVYDTESTKTVGLVNRIRAERKRPRCDVFWNNEILNTLLLSKEGLLRPARPPNASGYPKRFKSADGMWHGFAARARVLIVNTDRVKEDETPRSMYDLLRPEWKGEIGIAKPVAGTTASHVACLFQALGEEKAREYLSGLKANGVHIESGNKSCAVKVANGTLAFAWTDTDDAIIEVEAGRPVRIVYPDTEADGVGVLFIPNTLAAIRNSPNPREADLLIDYLLSPEVEAMLARGPSAQIPLNSANTVAPRVKGPQDVPSMTVDFQKAADQWRSAQGFITKEFLR
ncbi:MAG: extracellular solute-binding protein [Phycisphaerae bacterium]|nr:extracellular solute-binding protein [Phycisphaerae bacterium]